jgi:putative ABC transport system permease protein
MADEMRLHLEALTETNVAAGMTPEEARFDAEKHFGRVTQIAEQCREQRGLAWLEQFAKDAKFAFRSLARARGFTIAVVATLALGIGVATVVFDLTAWLLIFSQPYPNPAQLYVIGYRDNRSSFTPYRSGFQFQAYVDQTKVFTEFAAVKQSTTNVVREGTPTVAKALSVSADCFHTLGVQPILGRSFLPEEYREGADQVVVISDLFWRQYFGADPAVLGQSIEIDQRPYTVIGVLSAAQRFPENFSGDIYRPLVLKNDPARIDDPAKIFDGVLFVIGRLRPGVTPTQAATALTAVKLPTLPQWAAAFFSGQQPALLKLTDMSDKASYWVMLIASGLLFAIACFNTMNLMLVRLLGRDRELTIRLALGASRWRIARLLMIESLGLALAAWTVVMLLALWFFPVAIAYITRDPGVRYQSYWDWKTLGCMAGLGLVATLVVAAVPMIRLAKADLNAGLKAGGAAVGDSRNTARVRNVLVIIQTALAVILLTGTGLMTRTFQKLHHVDLGFDPVGKVKVFVAFPRGFELKNEARLAYFQRLQERLCTIPGIKNVAFGSDALLVGGFYGTAQLQMADGTFMPISGSYASDNYQQTAGMRLKMGRWLSGEHRRNEVVINEALAKARFGDRNPVGENIKLLVSGNHPFEVVGVVRDVRETVRSSAGPHIYLPNWKFPPNSSTLVLRLDHNPSKEFAGIVRRALYDFDPRLVASDVSSIDEVLDNSVAAERYAFTILRMLSGIALGLAAIGLFSVIAYSVHTRMMEYGVRLALGANPTNLKHLVLRRGLTTVGIGVTIGLIGSMGMTHFMRSLLFETTPYDLVVHLAVAALLLAAAALACWLPARRAARVDITRLLKAE